MRFAEKCFIFVLLSFLVLTNFEFSNPGMANRVEVIRTRGTIVVNASGGGDFMKIQPAIDAAQVGDTVYVEKGNYNENIEINKSIDLVGEGSEEVLIFKDSWWPVVDITSDDVNISGFSIADGDRGISLSGASNCIITNINFTGNSIGLEIDDWRGNSYDNQITNNIFYDNGDGIYINNNDGNEIIDNNLTHNWNGIHILSSKNTRIASNTCTFNGADGINVWSSNNTEISFNNCSNNGIHGIFLVESDTIEISSNNCLQNIVGIKLNNSYDVLIDRNECNNNYRDGICVSLTDNYTYNSNDNILKDNICNSNSQNGISLQQSENNYIINNTCLENGISLVESDGCYLINNTCTEKWFGIMMDRSRNNYLERNVLVKNGLNIRGDSLSHWNTHSIDTSNVVNGKPLRFLKNTTGETVPVGSGQIILAYCTNMVIENQEFTNVAVGITIAFSSHCVISNNTCNSIGSGFDYVGIQLSHSHDNIVSGNQCNSNQGTIMGSGIELYCSDRNEVIENTCDLNHHYGISIRYSFDNVVSNNTCSRNGADGIFLYSSNNNIIDNNTIISNGEYGITTAYWSEYNSIFFNNLIDNNNISQQASDRSLNNNWNISGKGNYWSDHTEPDSNLDGIVDQKYYLDGTADAKDHYPLTAPVHEIIPVANPGNNIEIDQHETVTFNDCVSLYCALIVNSTWNFTYDDKEVLLYGSPVDFTFHTAGKYLVELTVRNCVGDETNDTLLVTVNDITPPIANAGEDFTVIVGEPAYFNASNSSDNVAITVYRWRLYYIDEEISLYGRIAPFTFNKLGIYHITLDVLDAAGFSSSDKLNVTVVDATPPVADAGDNYTIQPGTTVYFDGSDSTDNIQIINYTWSFLYNRMNIKLYGEKTSFTFHIMGNYTVTLVVKDLFDLEGLDSIFVSVVPEEEDSDDEKPNADAGENLTVDKNSTVQLNSGGSSDNEGIVNYTWIIEYDGSNITLNRTNAIFRFEKIGVYNVTLRVEDAAGNFDEDRIMIIVQDREDDDTTPDDVNPDDSDPSDGGRGKEGASSIYIWLGIILLVFIGAGIGLAIVIIRKKTTDDVEKPQENEFGRTGNEG